MPGIQKERDNVREIESEQARGFQTKHLYRESNVVQTPLTRRGGKYYARAKRRYERIQKKGGTGSDSSLFKDRESDR